MMLSLKHRQESDDRSIGELFMVICDEIQDLTMEEALFLIINAILASVHDKFSLTEQQLDRLIQEFVTMLPRHIQNRLLQAA
jgi:hypothetical protein